MSTEIKHEPVKREGWEPGPWDGEPDRVEWKTKAGMPGMIIRNHSGAWCGYVAVPPGHPLHGKHYNDPEVDVHGGLTYGEACSGHICHVPEPGEPDNVWWFGFDCAHSGDFVPGMNYHLPPNMRDTLGLHTSYRTMDYAKSEVEKLAEQLAATA